MSKHYVKSFTDVTDFILLTASCIASAGFQTSRLGPRGLSGSPEVRQPMWLSHSSHPRCANSSGLCHSSITYCLFKFPNLGS